MFKKISIAALCLLMLSTAACGSDNTAPGNNSVQSNASDNSGSKRNTAGEGFNDEMRSNPADLSGEVTSVSGNEITLKVIDMPSFGGGQKPSKRDGENSKNTGDTKAAGNSNAASDKDNSQGNGKAPQNDSRQPQMSFKYTGENKTITIPDGMAISSDRRDSQGKELSVSDIKEGNILRIWYSDDEKEAISKVSVMQSVPQQSRDTQEEGDK
ncbi:hypothetical protein LY28_03125 [Ruminiclostridium sufflavum DSM 19573]|uniref:Lipoprotein n=1 Tax=Ruminiclostridium sufflavum DSM 19573 TaxID=1121337 RepID=A0A318XJD0_9FIRM|nr:hypothetical protein [Ruminiclostridium sufflavum]PYG85828.1 hypothetical protein LY28_03125 [Ruminiclostridium sufflavum DSM 19573]